MTDSKNCGYCGNVCPSSKPMCNNGVCSPKVECYGDYNCPADEWKNLQCKDGDVWGTFIDYYCSNPGTTQSKCFFTSSFKRKKPCYSGYSCDNWNDYCEFGNVWQKRTCHEKGCSGGACFDRKDIEKKEKETCDYGCHEGLCDVRFNLKKGVNLFSLPRDSSVSFNELKTDCDVVYENGHYDLAYYSPSDNLDLSNYRFISLNSKLNPGQGYMVKVRDDCYVEMEEGGAVDSNFQLASGWNLIGAPSSSETFDKGTCLLYDINGEDVGILKYEDYVESCSEVEGWNGLYEDCVSEYGTIRCRCSVDSYEPGKGYWIRTKNYCTLG